MSLFTTDRSELKIAAMFNSSEQNCASEHKLGVRANASSDRHRGSSSGDAHFSRSQPVKDFRVSSTTRCCIQKMRGSKQQGQNGSNEGGTSLFLLKNEPPRERHIGKFTLPAPSLAPAASPAAASAPSLAFCDEERRTAQRRVSSARWQRKTPANAQRTQGLRCTTATQRNRTAAQQHSSTAAQQHSHAGTQARRHLLASSFGMSSRRSASSSSVSRISSSSLCERWRSGGKRGAAAIDSQPQRAVKDARTGRG
jgi:hypothetical protein